MQRFLAERAAEWWVAELDSRIIGYARSIERDGLFELTEFFVLPGLQSKGVGRSLLAQAFPNGRGVIRSIIATTDERALARYYAAGTAPRFPILSLIGPPHRGERSDGLNPHRLTANSAAELRAVREIELAALESARGDAEMRWLLDDREGYVYMRRDDPVGFAFVGKNGVGPIAATEVSYLPDLLLTSRIVPPAWDCRSLISRCPRPTRWRLAIY